MKTTPPWEWAFRSEDTMNSSTLFALAREYGPQCGDAATATVASAKIDLWYANFAAIAREAFGQSDDGAKAAALAGVHALRNYFTTMQRGDPNLLVEAASVADGDQQGDLYRFAGDAFVRREDGLEAAQSAYKDAIRVYQGTRNVRFQTSCLRGLGDVHWRLNEWNDAEKAWQQALWNNQHGAVAPDGLMMANLMRRLGNGAYVRQLYPLAEGWLLQADSIYVSLGDNPIDHADCVVALARVRWSTGRQTATIDTAKIATEMFRRNGDRLGLSRCLALLSSWYNKMDRSIEANTSMQEATTIHTELGLSGEPTDVIR